MTLLAQFDPGMAAILAGISAAAIVAIVVLTAALFNLVLHRSGPRVRHSVWLAALVLCALSPALIVLVDHAGLVVLPLRQPAATPAEFHPRPLPEPEPRESIAPPQPTVVRQVERITKAPEPADVSPIATAPVPAVAARPITWAHVRAMLFLIWLAGALFMFFRLIHGVFSLFLLKRSAQPLEPALIDSLSSSIQQALGTKLALPRIATSTLPMEIPIAAGVFRHVVILPPQMIETLSHEQLRDVLVHECAHAMRHDGLIGLLQRLTTLIFWPHPLIHWLNRRLAVTREEVCDDYVLNNGDPARYAEGLLNLALTLGNKRPHPSAPGMLDNTSNLERRITRILEPGRTPPMRPNRWITAGSTLVLTVLAVLVAGIRPVARAEPQEKQVTKATPLADPKPPGTVISGIVVDEAGKPVAGAMLDVTNWDEVRTTARSETDGTFKLDTGRYIGGWSHLWVRARVEGRKLEGQGEYRGVLVPRSLPLRIVLHPTRPLRVRVIDSKEKPTAGASVIVCFSYYSRMPTVQTGADGSVTLDVPVEPKVSEIVAYKENAGLDYVEMFAESSPVNYKPLAAEVTLKFEPPQTVRFRAVDSENKPVAGARLLARIGMPGKVRNLFFQLPMGDAPTGPDGLGTLTYLPPRARADVSASAPGRGRSQGGFVNTNPTSNLPTTKLDEIQIVRLPSLAKIQGRVTHADGSPAQGITVTASSYRTQESPWRNPTTKTDADGRYTMNVEPEDSFVVAVVDRKLAAPPVGGLLVKDGKDSHEVNFKLGGGTRLHGRFAIDKKGNLGDYPAEWLMVRAKYLGEERRLKFGTIAPPSHRESVNFETRIDADGSYELTLPAGDYEITMSDDRELLKTHLDGTGELVRNFDNPIIEPKRRTITGIVVDATPGAPEKPLSGVSVSSYFNPDEHDHFKFSNRTRSDEAGRFSITLDEGIGALTAHTADAKLAGYLEVSSDTKDVILRLIPTAEVTGRLLNSKGQPYVAADNNEHVTLGLTKPGPKTSAGSASRIDQDGRYRFRVVVPRGEYAVKLTVLDGTDPPRQTPIKTITIDHPGVFDLGDFRVPDLPQPKP